MAEPDPSSPGHSYATLRYREEYGGGRGDEHWRKTGTHSDGVGTASCSRVQNFARVRIAADSSPARPTQADFDLHSSKIDVPNDAGATTNTRLRGEERLQTAGQIYTN